MITLTLLLIISAIVLGLVFLLLSVGGTVIFILAADLIVALAIVWFIIKMVRRKKRK